MTVSVSGDKAWHHIHRLVVEILEGLFYQLGSQIGINHVLALLLLCADEITAVHTNTVLDHRCHDMRTQALTITDDSVFGLFRQVVNKIHTVEYTLQLIEELVYIIE